jgi:hypothetical protein
VYEKYAILRDRNYHDLQELLMNNKEEPRQAYGTAKTENLRDSGLWRIFLPAIVIVGCLSLSAIPLIVLVPLLMMALDPHSPSGPAGVQLAWLWVTMIIIVLSCAAIIVQGLLKILKPA